VAPSDARPTGVAPDGSPVEVYRNLPTRGEPEIIDAAIAPKSTILELGCGTGRITRALVALGHRVVAVDSSAEMLAALDGVANVEPIEADILELDLGRRFDVVIAGSNLVNSPVPNGDRFMEVAAHHVADRGALLVEVYPPSLDWAAWVGRRSDVGPVGITVRSAVVDGDRLDAVVVYDLDGRLWEQPFSARLLDEAALRRVVAAAGLAFDRWLDERAGWFRAVRDARREAAT
jgi:SAM-dependent methyltransferase